MFPDHDKSYSTCKALFHYFIMPEEGHFFMTPEILNQMHKCG